MAAKVTPASSDESIAADVLTAMQDAEAAAAKAAKAAKAANAANATGADAGAAASSRRGGGSSWWWQRRQQPLSALADAHDAARLNLNVHSPSCSRCQVRLRRLCRPRPQAARWALRVLLLLHTAASGALAYWLCVLEYWRHARPGAAWQGVLGVFELFPIDHFVNAIPSAA